MGYAKINLEMQRLLDLDQAGQYLRYPELLQKMRRKGWIKPVIDTRKMMAFDVRQLDECVNRLLSGETLD